MSGQIGLKLFELLAEDGNGECADCGSSDPPPRWASSSLGIYLCVNCVGIHRGLGVNLSITKSIELDKWTETMFEYMSSMGNKKSNEIWAKNIPICWKRPTPDDHHLDFYVEEWIRAKYERKEFKKDRQSEPHYCLGDKDGFLSKRERHANKWNQRYFRLSAETSSLSYYNKKEDLTPIRRMDIKDINVMLCDHSKTDKFFSMQISAPEEKHKKGKKSTKSTRNIFVHAETGKEIVEWFLAIRAARFKALGLSGAESDVDQILSRNYIKEGLLKKSGPKENDKYQQRWIAVEPNKFSYFEDKLDSVPKGEVILKNSPELYSVAEGIDGKHPDEPHPFMVQTPERVYNFAAETAKDMEEWMQAFNKGMEMTLNISNHRMSVASAVSQISQLSVSSSDSNSST